MTKNKTCPKCNGTSITGPRHVASVPVTGMQVSIGEGLHYQCRGCGYSWYTATKDKHGSETKEAQSLSKRCSEAASPQIAWPKA